MHVEAVIVGSELCNGTLSDTHAARFGAALRDYGLRLSRAVIVGDDEVGIIDSLRSGWERSDLLLVSGGLGPTTDDRTLQAAACAADVDLVLDPGARDRISAWYRGRGSQSTEAQLAMAWVPAGAVALPNPVGSAPAVWFSHGSCQSLFLPGVPREVDRLLQEHLTPWLRDHPVEHPWTSHLYRTFGAPESELAAALHGLPTGPGMELAFRATFPEVLITAHLQVGAQSDATGEGWLDEVKSRLEPWLYGTSVGQGLPEVVGGLLAQGGHTLALAESCTGGMLTAALTEVPGASSWLVEGVITYANDSKYRRLGVPLALMEEHGAVSEAVASSMAQGVRATAGTDLGLAITGIAGPSGGSPGKPVGTVHFALASDQGLAHLHRWYPYADRARNRRISTWEALDLLRRHLSEHHT